MGKVTVDRIRWVYGIVGKHMCVGMSPDEFAELKRLLEVAIMREDVLRSKGPSGDLQEVLERGRL